MELDEQKKTLLREQEYAEDMQRLKEARGKTMYEAFGLSEPVTARAKTECTSSTT